MSSLWAYAYQIVPPQPSHRLGTIRTLLKEENAAAHGSARTWSGRLVLEPETTHILIVSEVLGRHHPINLRLEAELMRLDAAFSVTEPLEVADHPEGVQRLSTYAGNGR